MEYIRITLHDSDFWNELHILGRYLWNIINDTPCSYEINEAVKRDVADFIASSHCLLATLQRRYEDKEEVLTYVTKHLSVSIVSDKEINPSEKEADTLYVAISYIYDPEYSYFVV